MSAIGEEGQEIEKLLTRLFSVVLWSVSDATLLLLNHVTLQGMLVFPDIHIWGPMLEICQPKQNRVKICV